MNNIIYILNKSKLVNNSDFSSIITACNALLPIFCKNWNLSCPIIMQLSSNININDNSFALITLIDFISSNNSNSLKYHVEAKPILDNGGVILYKNESTITVASCIFSEICNLLIDKSLTGWWINNTNNSSYAIEVCDQVQTNIVKIIVGNSNNKNGVIVGLSDFIFPSWKDINSVNVPLNYMQTLTEPFSCSNTGSFIKFSLTDGVTYHFGKNVPNWLQNLKKESYKYNFRKSTNKTHQN